MSFAGSGLKAGCRRGQVAESSIIVCWAEGTVGLGRSWCPRRGGDWEQYAMCVCTCVLMHRQAH